MNKKSIATIFCLLGVAGIYWLAQAGPLEPPGPPTEPTGHNLQEIYDKVDEGCGAGQYAIPKTGQAVSHAEWDDGSYQAGVSVETRFTDNNDGTVTDDLTGLIWLEDASCLGPKRWTAALAAANELAEVGSPGGCGLSDGSEAGNWRLPNVRELRSLIDYGEAYPALPEGHLFSNVQTYKYWSSTTSMRPLSAAWAVIPESGIIETVPKTEDDLYVWPVKGGQ